jgi:hypothetical protein
MGTTRRRGIRFGCLFGLIALTVTLVTGLLLSTLSFYGSSVCMPGSPNCNDTSNPFGLPILVVGVLFLVGVVGTTVSGIQTLWRIGAFVVRGLRGVKS